MPRPAQSEPVELDNHLAWEGWQTDLPSSWNPIRLTGSARAGTVTVADLERPRLELNWRRVRSARRVDLARLARGRRRTTLDWTPLRPPLIGEGIADARRAVADTGDVLALLLSRRSPRLLLVKIFANNQHAITDPLLASIADATGSPTVPWCVYGFAWSVPEGLQLSDRVFDAGRARLTFRHRRRSLTFQRTTLVGRPPPNAGPDAEVSTIPATVLEHNGHEIPLRRVGPTAAWHRGLTPHLWTADWVCPASQRRYRVEATGPDAPNLLQAAVRGVGCHRLTAPARPP